MNDELLTRYSKQIMLPEIDVSGQKNLLQSKVLIVGAGGLGNPVAMYLASAGVGQIIINDFDTVELSNLPRQVFFAESDIGRPKVDSLAEAICRNNPGITVKTINEKLSSEQLRDLASQCNIVLDCTDNYQARHDISKAAKAAKIPLISAAAIRTDGLLIVFSNRDENAPCYGCFSSNAVDTNETCSTSGILGPAVAAIASLQASEAIKILAGNNPAIMDQAFAFDFSTLESHTFNIRSNRDCLYC